MSSSSNQKNLQKPKRPLSAYFIFCRENREIIKQQNPNMRAVELTKQLAEIWKSLTDEEKQIYQDQAQQLKNEYEIALRDYENQN
ncbi:high mobility group protein dsp1 [Anaeramoeba ignava]|uniref:High mobility group protein dsp1 n=1 Tax=Anaeramoeba ignava TaxID=1746090 RepID=A0A9Q0LPH9_ANAIG|nr:high mobility group protein dsp1 [Anaeramoeba ignava]